MKVPKFKIDEWCKGKDYKTVVNPETGEKELAVEISEFNPQEVDMHYYSYEGFSVDNTMKDTEIRTWMWQCFVEGIHKELIFKVEMPTYDYREATTEPAKVKVYHHVLVD